MVEFYNRGKISNLKKEASVVSLRLRKECGDGGALPFRVHVDGADVVLRRGFRHDRLYHIRLDAAQIFSSPGWPRFLPLPISFV